ncbi:MAG: PD-(D/E)XK nuclease family protein, partial [Chloroflexi bacterium]|nr:PD-(D/E)XK nuclease family protein [Chloroflexota bacterium]
MIPEGFVFSQSSLQDYADCARRFQLRYLERRRWPAPATADALDLEKHVRRGQAFHRLMRQAYAGIPVEALSELAASDSSLGRWWSNYLETPPLDLPAAVCEAEVTLSTPLRRYRLEARYDLLAGIVGQRWVIVDWKTGPRRSARAWLERRLQTRLYPFVLVEAGACLN